MRIHVVAIPEASSTPIIAFSAVSIIVDPITPAFLGADRERHRLLHCCCLVGFVREDGHDGNNASTPEECPRAQGVYPPFACLRLWTPQGAVALLLVSVDQVLALLVIADQMLMIWHCKNG